MLSIPKPIVRPDEVRGFMGNQESRVDRVFRVLEEASTEDRVWFIDGYKLVDGNTGQIHWKLVLVCPVCDRTLALESQKKPMELDRDGLQVEEFRCTWPGDFGSPQCNFAAAIVKPPRGKHQFRTSDGVLHRIDGLFRRA